MTEAPKQSTLPKPQRSDRLRALNISDPSLIAPLNNLVTLAKETSSCSCAYLAFISDTHELIRFSTDFRPIEIPLALSINEAFANLEQALGEFQRIQITDRKTESKPLLSQEPYSFNSFLSFAIRSKDSFVLGTLTIVSTSKTIELPDYQINLLRDLASHAGSVIELHNKLAAVQRTISSLEDSEERFRRIADASPVLLWISDQAGNRTLSNRAWCDFTGLSEEESLAECWRQAVHPKDLGVYKAKWNSVAKSGTNFQHEYRLRHASGTYRWVIEQAIPLFSSSGRLEAYVSSCLDLSLRSSDELQYQHNEARFRAISEAAPLGIVVADSSGNCIYSNQRFQEISSLNAEECIGSGWLKNVHADDLQGVLDSWNQANKSAENFEHTARFKRYPAECSWCTLKAATINSTDTISGWVITVEDITAKRRADEELLQAKHAAIAAMNAKSQFLANMSHEIRTPLTAIIGFADSLFSDGRLDPAHNHCIELILNNGKHLLNIINQILDLSKIDAGALNIEHVEFSLTDLLEDLHFMFTPTASEKGLKLNLNFNSPLPVKIKSDPLRLKQILINLVGNAIKFTKTGAIDVIVIWNEAYKKVAFCVRDTGIGLSSEQIQQLFHPFYQANSSITRTFGGTGLGLSITKRLIDALGGSIKVSSEIGSGSQFYFEIPSYSLEHYTQDSIHHTPSNQRQIRLKVAAQPMLSLAGYVLFADDALDNRRLVEHLLSRAGVKVKLVENGLEATQAALREEFNLILMDIQMPVVDGLTATRQLRAAGVSTPIIAVSAGAMVSDIEIALKAGCNAHLSKPFESRVFYDLIRSHLVKHEDTISNSAGGFRPNEKASGDSELAALTREFIARLADRLTSLEEDIRVLDWAALTAEAHKLKGSSGMYGFLELSKIASRLEDAGKKRSQKCMLNEFSALKSEISRITTYNSEPPIHTPPSPSQ
jgi:PAS domain S-box-containing protein